MRVDPKSLLRRLSSRSTRLLEAALGRASTGGFYEIVPEHLLRSMLEDENDEASRLFAHFGVDRGRVVTRLDRILNAMKTGNAGRPVFSDTFFRWIEDAWLFASVETGAGRLRSGMLLVQFVAQRARYTGESFPELEDLTFDALKRGFDEAVHGSPEEAELAAGAAQAGSAPVARGEEALRRFATNFTERAREGKIDPIFGRDTEIRQMIDILARRRKNNPILVGEPGVGKSALVEGLARAIVAGDVPEPLRPVELWGLDLGLLQAGASVRGEFENRLKAVIDEVKSSPRPIILFIDEAHTLIGAGGNAGGSDAANLLKPALARGELRTIAATTWAEYKKYFEKDAALERRFQPVKVEEPSEDDAVVMLRGLAPLYEKAHGVVIRDEAIVAAVRLSHRYLASRQLPDKAVDLLDTAAARVKVALDTRPEELVSLESKIAAIERERDAKKRDVAEGAGVGVHDLEEVEARLRAAVDTAASLRARWEGERQAVKELLAAKEAARAEGASEAESAALREATEKLAQLQGEELLVHPEVDADAVARVLASWTGIPVGKMKSSAVGAFLDLESRIAERVRGQADPIKKVAETLQMSMAGVRSPDAPRGVLLFVGSSGVGKTETALALADALYGGERFLITINMSEFQEKHSVSRLIGSPPGYVGYGEGGRLTEAVRQRPYSVVLLDECEKADLEVMNLFYQVFDKGVLNDGEGRTIDFRNTVIILTSNLATEELMQISSLPVPVTFDETIEAIRPTLSRHFKPALLARMTIVPFRPMSLEILREIVQMKLNALASRLQTAHRMKTTWAPELLEELAARCSAGETGARNVEHVLSGSLLPVLSREILQRVAGSEMPTRVHIGLTPEKDWSFDFA